MCIYMLIHYMYLSILITLAVCCSVLQSDAVCCRVLQCVAVCCSVCYAHYPISIVFECRVFIGNCQWITQGCGGGLHWQILGNQREVCSWETREKSALCYSRFPPSQDDVYTYIHVRTHIYTCMYTYI